MKLNTFFLFFLGLTVCFASAESADVLVNVPFTAQAPGINGDLSEPAWKSALVLENFFVVENGKGSEATDKVRASLMRDEAWLYIAVKIRHPVPSSIVPKFTEPDSPVQRENSIEIALVPGAADGQWYNFGLSAGNVQSEMKVDKNRSVPFMRRPWRSATRITTDGWEAELALPLKSLLQAKPDEGGMRLNIIATILVPIYDSNHIEVGQRRLLASLTPRPDTNWMADETTFPTLEGLHNTEFKRVFLPSLKRVEVSSYDTVDGAYTYNVTANISAFAGEPGEVTIEVIDRPQNSSPPSTPIRKTASLKANEQRQITIPVPVTSLEPRTVTIRLLTGEDVWGQQILENPQELNVFEAFLDRNYYTSEPQAELTYRFGLSDTEALKGGKIEVMDPKGQIVASTSAIDRQGSMPIKLTEVGLGTHTLEVRYVDAKDTVIAREPFTLTKRAPHPSGEWKIDRVNLRILRDGKPFFPMGVYMQGGHLMTEEEAKDVADAGFNSIVDYHAGQTIKTATDYLDTARRHGLFVSLRVEAFAHSIEGGGLVDAKSVVIPPALKEKYFPGNTLYSRFHDIRKYCDRTYNSATEKSNAVFDLYRQVLPAMTEGVRGVKDHPALMAWDGFDEYNASASPTLMIKAGRDLHREMNEIDGYHPIRVLAGGSPPPGSEFTDWTDIIAGDPYWSPTNYSSVFRVAKLTAEMVARGREERKPAWITPVLMMWGNTYKRDFLPAEQRAQTYLALINGAGGLFFYVYPAQHELSWKTMSSLAKEVNQIQPALVSPGITQSITYEPASEPTKADIQVVIKPDPRGGYLMLAANAQPYPVDAQFQIPGLGTGTAKVLFEPQGSVAVADGKFEEKFEGYGTRAYQLTPPKPLAEPLAIKVRTTPHPEPAETAYTEAGRTDKRNVIPNPSFEDSSLPGWPQYWKVVNSSFKGPSRRIGGKNPQFTLDTKEAVEGKSSLRLESGSRIYLYIRPGVKTPTDYVFSVFLKSDVPGTKITFAGNGDSPRIPLNTTWVPTAEWKRYSAVVRIGPDLTAFPGIMVTVPDSKPEGRVWIDGMQFEPGREPTEFQP